MKEPDRIARLEASIKSEWEKSGWETDPLSELFDANVFAPYETTQEYIDKAIKPVRIVDYESRMMLGDLDIYCAECVKYYKLRLFIHNYDVPEECYKEDGTLVTEIMGDHWIAMFKLAT